MRGVLDSAVIRFMFRLRFFCRCNHVVAVGGALEGGALAAPRVQIDSCRGCVVCVRVYVRLR